MLKKYVIDESIVEKYGITDNLDVVVAVTTDKDIAHAIDSYELGDEYLDLKGALEYAHNDHTLEGFLEEYQDEFNKMTQDDIGATYIDYILERITNIEIPVNC